MDKVSRLSLVLSIIRRFVADTKKYKPRYNKDELTSELYIYVDGLIKSNPFIDDETIVELGKTFCRKVVKRDDRLYGKVDTRERNTDRERFNKPDELLSIWCANRTKRNGKKWFSRILAYLHYVEQIPITELTEMFNKTQQAVYSTVTNIHKPRNKFMLKPNDIVLLVMNNPFFNHMLAWVKEPTEWGAVVEVESHCYPHRQRWELRAMTEEIVYVGTLADMPQPSKIDESVDGNKRQLSNAQAVQKGRHVYTANTLYNGKDVNGRQLYKDPQFTGDECTSCGKMMMIRAGTCLTCMHCGMTTGC